jgi:hypothetical protein
MNNTLSDKSSKPLPLYFEQSKSETVAAISDAAWWDRERYRVGGLLRVASRLATIASGLGVATTKNPWRVGYGGVGLAAGGFISVFGEKADNKTPKELFGMSRENVGRIYHGIVAAGGGLAVIAGLMSKPQRFTETLSGIWTLGWSAYAALAPEPIDTPLAFDNQSTKAVPVGFMKKESEKGFWDKYKDHPKKLASDMLQFSAVLATADGFKHRDVARLISGITLGASNYLQREMTDADFKTVRQPVAER